MVLESCPFCHRPFAAEQVSREQVDSSKQNVLKFFTTYKILYKCKHCGKEWSKTETVEREVEGKVAWREQASEADVAREAEEAREEQEAERY